MAEILTEILAYGRYFDKQSKQSIHLTQSRRWHEPLQLITSLIKH